MSKILDQKIALVTGGSRGIGAAIVKRLAREGANVALTYASSPKRAREVVAAAEALGVKAIAIQADSANTEAVTAAVERTVVEFGGLDILVNNAGVLAVAPLEEFKLEDFDRTVAVNIRAVFVATQAAACHMKDGGRIINIGSTNAERMPFAGGGVYAMSKSALQGLAQGLARDLGPRGITINNVQPGPVNTEMNPEDGASAEMLKKINALPRYGTAEEIAGMVAYLAGPEAGYVTGASLMIDGGFSA
ncbi:MAG TPA: 3-oxoacyl-ACP reductase family protein [Chthoniobacterales bacterium]|nr:3-oxoacyl-ACP reductase family protein [Chthoniobacterales bacterium]